MTNLPPAVPVFQSQPPQGLPPRKKGGVLKYFAIGCLGIILLVAIALVVVVMNFKAIATNTIRSIAVNAVNKSQLAPDQKAGVIKHIDRVTEDYKAGRITNQQLGRVMEEIARSPVLKLGVVYMFDAKYLQPSGLPPDEKAAASRTLQRIARGVHENTITEPETRDLFDMLQTTDVAGNKKLKDSLTDSELRALIAAAKTLADKKQIPDEPFQVDVSAEIGKAIDRALKSPASPELPPPSTQPESPAP